MYVYMFYIHIYFFNLKDSNVTGSELQREAIANRFPLIDFTVKWEKG